MTRSRCESCLTVFSRFLRVSAAMLTLAVCALACAPCSADVVEPPEALAESSASSVNVVAGVRVGIARAYKNGFQTQVVVLLSDEVVGIDSLALELETRDADGAPFIYRRDVTQAELAELRVETCFMLPKASGALVVRAIYDDEVVDEKTFLPNAASADPSVVEFDAPTSPAKPIYLIVGDDKVGFAEAFAELRLKEERRPAIIRIESLEQLPTDFRSYEAIDRLFLTTTDLSAYDGYTASSPQILAIERWLERGGALTIFAGKDSLGLLNEGGALSTLYPGASVAPKTHEFRAVNAFTSDLQNVKNLAMGSRSNPYLRTPVIEELKDGANVEMREAETPLLVSRAVGLGTTIFFAADLAEAPIANWSGRGRLMLKILGVDPDVVSSKDGSANIVKRGYVDYSGQIRSSLDRFTGVAAVPFSLVAVLLLAYVVVIAPLDWFLVKKVFKRPIITWISFPVYVILFAVLAIGVCSSRTPKEETFNQLDLIDVDMTTGMTRDISWFGLYSPVGNRYDLVFAPELSGMTLEQDFDANVMPLPLSGSALGGAEQTTFMPRLWDEPYRVADGALRDIPAATRSSKSFVARWTGKTTGLPTGAFLSDDSLSLRGTVVNPFDVPIYSAYVVYQGGACALGTLPPGETVIDRGSARMEPMRVVNEQKSSVPTKRAATWDSTTYNSATTRLPYILRSATFYDFAGGVDNFGIEKRLQRDVDLSALLRCGRAVVYGVIVDPECEEYKPTDDLARVSADAVEMERLNKKLAEQKGEEYRNTKVEALEKYGLYGTSPEFKASDAKLMRSADGESSARAADNRTVVARLIVPIRFGTHESKENK